MTTRLLAGLSDRTAIGLAAASLALAGALALIPALEPWRDRATWILAWGAAVYLAAALAAAWASTPPASEAVIDEQPPLPPLPLEPAATASPSVPKPLPSGPYPDGLTAREVEVLRLIAAGSTNRQIAAALVVSVATAERHIANIYAKIGVTNRAEATAYALRHGLAT